MKNTFYTAIALILISCAPSKSQDKESGQGFKNYWYGGEAEISSYALQQSRYGEIHNGEAVLIFVTEPFSKSKQVKLDNWRDTSPDNVSVMKLNMTKKFLTGIYPYSMMMSTFTPVSMDKHPKPFKVTASSQEWCGHTFMQLNLNNEKYQLKGFSYFESEGDVSLDVNPDFLEDELWSKIRLGPSSLPIGKYNVLPSTFYLRLKHQDLKPKKSEMTLLELADSEFSNTPHKKYTIKYQNRTLAIYFEKEFPYTILGWEETYLGGFGTAAEELTTKARRLKTIKSPYWSKNANADRILRKELGLSLE